MFQDVNVTKAAPFALLTEYQKSLYPPKKILVSPQSFQNCPHFGKLREIRRPFSIWTTRNGNLKYHSKLREIRLIRQRQRQTT